MLRAPGKISEAIFLTSDLAGVALLVGSFVAARLNWRRDIPPYSLRTRSLDVLLHPAKYVLPQVLPIVRIFSVLGLLLPAIAVATLARQGQAELLH